MKFNFALPVVALFVGAAMGYCLKPAAPAPEDDAKGEHAVRRSEIAEKDGAAEKALRGRVRELERELAALTAEKSSEKIEEDQASRPRDGRPSREEMRANFEKFKQEHPEEWARMEKRRQDFMKRRQERAQSKMDFLSSIDTSTMSESARANHENLMTLISKRAELESKMGPGLMDLSDEDRDAIFKEMHDTEHAIREANREERDALLQQTAEVLGFSGDEASEIVDTVKEIYEATSSDRGGPGGPGGPGGRGPGGGRGRGRR